ncbi:hypothetical protein [Salininema proteolyticum]|uniref:Uncharacterized protein n=1 Tax=Salininema proteolyticum TaxID=1607685 RepID=A0ABV8U1P5_9ACTN
MPDTITIRLAPDETWTPSQLDSVCEELELDFKEIRGVAAETETTPPKPGSKSGGGIGLGTIVLSGLFSSAGLTAITTVIVALIKRTKVGEVTIRRGDNEATVKDFRAKDTDKVFEQIRKVVGADE